MQRSITQVLGFILLAICLTQVAFAQTKQWDAKRTWVFMVCLVEWKDPATWASFPKTNRKDIVLRETLKGRGVPANQIVYLQDKFATSKSESSPEKIILFPKV